MSLLHKSRVDVTTRCTCFCVEGAVVLVNRNFLQFREVEEEALAVKLLSNDDFLPEWETVHPDDDLVVVVIGERDQVGQFVDGGGGEPAAAQSVVYGIGVIPGAVLWIVKNRGHVRKLPYMAINLNRPVSQWF